MSQAIRQFTGGSGRSSLSVLRGCLCDATLIDCSISLGNMSYMTRYGAFSPRYPRCSNLLSHRLTPIMVLYPDFLSQLSKKDSVFAKPVAHPVGIFTNLAGV